jgi:hypothetical protein
MDSPPASDSALRASTGQDAGGAKSAAHHRRILISFAALLSNQAGAGGAVHLKFDKHFGFFVFVSVLIIFSGADIRIQPEDIDSRRNDSGQAVSDGFGKLAGRGMNLRHDRFSRNMVKLDDIFQVYGDHPFERFMRLFHRIYQFPEFRRGVFNIIRVDHAGKITVADFLLDTDCVERKMTNIQHNSSC